MLREKCDLKKIKTYLGKNPEGPKPNLKMNMNENLGDPSLPGFMYSFSLDLRLILM